MSSQKSDIEKPNLETTSWLRVGKVKAAHGLKGEFWVLLFAGEADWLENIEFFALGKDMDQPDRVIAMDQVRPHKDGILIKVPDVPDRNASEAIHNHFFFIPEDILVSEPGEQIFLNELLDFEVLDDGKILGRVVSFTSNGFQDLLEIKPEKGPNFEIPFVDDFIVDIDHEEAKIHCKLPEGLIEINLKGPKGQNGPDDGFEGESS